MMRATSGFVSMSMLAVFTLALFVTVAYAQQTGCNGAICGGKTTTVQVGQSGTVTQAKKQTDTSCTSQIQQAQRNAGQQVCKPDCDKVTYNTPSGGSVTCYQDPSGTNGCQQKTSGTSLCSDEKMQKIINGDSGTPTQGGAGAQSGTPSLKDQAAQQAAADQAKAARDRAQQELDKAKKSNWCAFGYCYNQDGVDAAQQKLDAAQKGYDDTLKDIAGAQNSGISNPVTDAAGAKGLPGTPGGATPQSNYTSDCGAGGAICNTGGNTTNPSSDFTRLPSDGTGPASLPVSKDVSDVPGELQSDANSKFNFAEGLTNSGYTPSPSTFNSNPLGPSYGAWTAPYTQGLPGASQGFVPTAGVSGPVQQGGIPVSPWVDSSGFNSALTGQSFGGLGGGIPSVAGDPFAGTGGYALRSGEGLRALGYGPSSRTLSDLAAGSPADVFMRPLGNLPGTFPSTIDLAKSPFADLRTAQETPLEGTTLTVAPPSDVFPVSKELAEFSGNANLASERPSTFAAVTEQMLGDVGKVFQGEISPSQMWENTLKNAGVAWNNAFKSGELPAIITGGPLAAGLNLAKQASNLWENAQKAAGVYSLSNRFSDAVRMIGNAPPPSAQTADEVFGKGFSGQGSAAQNANRGIADNTSVGKAGTQSGSAYTGLDARRDAVARAQEAYDNRSFVDRTRDALGFQSDASRRLADAQLAYQNARQGTVNTAANTQVPGQSVPLGEKTFGTQSTPAQTRLAQQLAQRLEVADNVLDAREEYKEAADAQGLEMRAVQQGVNGAIGSRQEIPVLPSHMDALNQLVAADTDRRAALEKAVLEGRVTVDANGVPTSFTSQADANAYNDLIKAEQKALENAQATGQEYVEKMDNISTERNALNAEVNRLRANEAAIANRVNELASDRVSASALVHCMQNCAHADTIEYALSQNPSTLSPQQQAARQALAQFVQKDYNAFVAQQWALAQKLGTAQDPNNPRGFDTSQVQPIFQSLLQQKPGDTIPTVPGMGHYDNNVAIENQRVQELAGAVPMSTEIQKYVNDLAAGGTTADTVLNILNNAEAALLNSPLGPVAGIGPLMVVSAAKAVWNTGAYLSGNTTLEQQLAELSKNSYDVAMYRIFDTANSAFLATGFGQMGTALVRGVGKAAERYLGAELANLNDARGLAGGILADDLAAYPSARALVPEIRPTFAQMEIPSTGGAMTFPARGTPIGGSAFEPLAVRGAPGEGSVPIRSASNALSPVEFSRPVGGTSRADGLISNAGRTGMDDPILGTILSENGERVAVRLSEVGSTHAESVPVAAERAFTPTPAQQRAIRAYEDARAVYAERLAEKVRKPKTQTSPASDAVDQALADMRAVGVEPLSAGRYASFRSDIPPEAVTPAITANTAPTAQAKSLMQRVADALTPSIQSFTNLSNSLLGRAMQAFLSTAQIAPSAATADIVASNLGRSLVRSLTSEEMLALRSGALDLEQLGARAAGTELRGAATAEMGALAGERVVPTASDVNAWSPVEFGRPVATAEKGILAPAQSLTAPEVFTPSPFRSPVPGFISLVPSTVGGLGQALVSGTPVPAFVPTAPLAQGFAQQPLVVSTPSTIPTPAPQAIPVTITPLQRIVSGLNEALNPFRFIGSPRAEPVTAPPFVQGISSVYTPGQGDISMEGPNIGYYSNEPIVNPKTGDNISNQSATLDTGKLKPYDIFEVCNRDSGKCLIRYAGDKGYFPGRVIDLVENDAILIGCPSNGTCAVNYRILASLDPSLVKAAITKGQPDRAAAIKEATAQAEKLVAQYQVGVPSVPVETGTVPSPSEKPVGPNSSNPITQVIGALQTLGNGAADFFTAGLYNSGAQAEPLQRNKYFADQATLRNIKSSAETLRNPYNYNNQAWAYAAQLSGLEAKVADALKPGQIMLSPVSEQRLSRALFALQSSNDQLARLLDQQAAAEQLITQEYPSPQSAPEEYQIELSWLTNLANQAGENVRVATNEFLNAARDAQAPSPSDLTSDQFFTPPISSTETQPTLPQFARKLVFYGVRPIGYWIGLMPDSAESLSATVMRGIMQAGHGLLTGEHVELSDTVGSVERAQIKNRLDAWAMYLGLPQRYDTFAPSQYKPALATDPNKQYYKINNFLENVKNSEDLFYAKSNTDAEAIRTFYDLVAKSSPTNTYILSDHTNLIMGSYTISLARDERGPYISYYDRWDLDGSIEGRVGFVGRPFEIYDRIYYNPQTFEPVAPPLQVTGSDIITGSLPSNSITTQSTVWEQIKSGLSILNPLNYIITPAVAEPTYTHGPFSIVTAKELEDAGIFGGLAALDPNIGQPITVTFEEVPANRWDVSRGSFPKYIADTLREMGDVNAKYLGNGKIQVTSGPRKILIDAAIHFKNALEKRGLIVRYSKLERTDAQNIDVEGNPNSDHKIGLAADGNVTVMSCVAGDAACATQKTLLDISQLERNKRILEASAEAHIQQLNLYGKQPLVPGESIHIGMSPFRNGAVGEKLASGVSTEGIRRVGYGDAQVGHIATLPADAQKYPGMEPSFQDALHAAPPPAYADLFAAVSRGDVTQVAALTKPRTVTVQGTDAGSSIETGTLSPEAKPVDLVPTQPVTKRINLTHADDREAIYHTSRGLPKAKIAIFHGDNQHGAGEIKNITVPSVGIEPELSNSSQSSSAAWASKKGLDGLVADLRTQAIADGIPADVFDTLPTVVSGYSGGLAARDAIADGAKADLVIDFGMALKNSDQMKKFVQAFKNNPNMSLVSVYTPGDYPTEHARLIQAFKDAGLDDRLVLSPLGPNDVIKPGDIRIFEWQGSHYDLMTTPWSNGQLPLNDWLAKFQPTATIPQVAGTQPARRTVTVQGAPQRPQSSLDVLGGIVSDAVRALTTPPKPGKPTMSMGEAVTKPFDQPKPVKPLSPSTVTNRSFALAGPIEQAPSEEALESMAQQRLAALRASNPNISSADAAANLVTQDLLHSKTGMDLMEDVVSKSKASRAGTRDNLLTSAETASAEIAKKAMALIQNGTPWKMYSFLDLSPEQLFIENDLFARYDPGAGELWKDIYATTHNTYVTYNPAYRATYNKVSDSVLQWTGRDLGLADLVIEGGNPDFLRNLYFAFQKMEADGTVAPGEIKITALFRDNTRQKVAEASSRSNVAAPGGSNHGNIPKTAGHGHGLAVDVSSPHEDKRDVIWSWIDRNGPKEGIHRPFPGDEPHVQPITGRRYAEIIVRQQNEIAAKVAEADVGSATTPQKVVIVQGPSTAIEKAETTKLEESPIITGSVGKAVVESAKVTEITATPVSSVPSTSISPVVAILQPVQLLPSIAITAVNKPTLPPLVGVARMVREAQLERMKTDIFMLRNILEEANLEAAVADMLFQTFYQRRNAAQNAPAVTQTVTELEQMAQVKFAAFISARDAYQKASIEYNRLRKQIITDTQDVYGVPYTIPEIAYVMGNLELNLEAYRRQLEIASTDEARAAIESNIAQTNAVIASIQDAARRDLPVPVEKTGTQTDVTASTARATLRTVGVNDPAILESVLPAPFKPLGITLPPDPYNGKAFAGLTRTERIQVIQDTGRAVNEYWRKVFEAHGKSYIPVQIEILSDIGRDLAGYQESLPTDPQKPGKVMVSVNHEVWQKAFRFDVEVASVQHVIAHEIGHYVQDVLGISAVTQKLFEKAPLEDLYIYSLRKELQADFLGGAALRDAGLLYDGGPEQIYRSALSTGDDVEAAKGQQMIAAATAFGHPTALERTRATDLGMRTGNEEVGLYMMADLGALPDWNIPQEIVTASIVSPQGGAVVPDEAVGTPIYMVIPEVISIALATSKPVQTIVNASQDIIDSIKYNYDFWFGPDGAFAVFIAAGPDTTTYPVVTSPQELLSTRISNGIGQAIRDIKTLTIDPIRMILGAGEIPAPPAIEYPRTATAVAEKPSAVTTGSIPGSPLSPGGSEMTLVGPLPKTGRQILEEQQRAQALEEAYQRAAADVPPKESTPEEDPTSLEPLPPNKSPVPYEAPSGELVPYESKGGELKATAKPAPKATPPPIPKPIDSMTARLDKWRASMVPSKAVAPAVLWTKFVPTMRQTILGALGLGGVVMLISDATTPACSPASAVCTADGKKIERDEKIAYTDCDAADSAKVEQMAKDGHGALPPCATADSIETGSITPPPDSKTTASPPPGLETPGPDSDTPGGATPSDDLGGDSGQQPGVGGLGGLTGALQPLMGLWQQLQQLLGGQQPGTQGTSADAERHSPSVFRFSCDPTSILNGGKVSINWACADNKKSTGTGFDTKGIPNGSVQHAIDTASSTMQFGVSCGGSAPRMCTVNVLHPQLTLVAVPREVEIGGKARIHWAGVHVSACAVLGEDGKEIGRGGAVGFVDTPAMTHAVAYAVVCSTSVGKPVYEYIPVTVAGDRAFPVKSPIPDGFMSQPAPSSAGTPAGSPQTSSTQGGPTGTGTQGQLGLRRATTAPNAPPGTYAATDAEGNTVYLCDPEVKGVEYLDGTYVPRQFIYCLTGGKWNCTPNTPCYPSTFRGEL